MITFEETVQTVLNLVKTNEQLKDSLRQAQDRIQELEAEIANPKKD
jgi:cell division protein FtsB